MYGMTVKLADGTLRTITRSTLSELSTILYVLRSAPFEGGSPLRPIELVLFDLVETSLEIPGVDIPLTLVKQYWIETWEWREHTREYVPGEMRPPYEARSAERGSATYELPVSSQWSPEID